MPTATRHRLLPLLAVPAVVAIVVTGVWVAGGVITDDYRASMAIAAYLLTAGAVGAYLGATTLRDDVVHERVITAAPPAAAPDTGAPETAVAAAPRPGPTELARGRFRSHEHATTGTARVIRDTDGRRYLTLTSFSTSPGPDLRVRLVPGDSFDGGADGAVDLGALKGNRGDQQYAIPSGRDVRDHTVVIWCRAFSAPFGSAELRAA